VTKTLNVPLIPQQTSEWCWAASAEMIMKYAGHDVAQCQQANHEFGRTDCCLTPAPGPCVNGGWPEFNVWQFCYLQTADGVALTWAQLVAEIDANRPVEFCWAWVGGGGHAMAARGYSYLAPIGLFPMVYINDPWAPNVGNTRWITYPVYVSQANDHSHWRDYYEIFYDEIGAKAGPARKEQENAMSPEPAAMTSGGYADPETAAREALKFFPMLVTPETAPELGFDAVPEDASALQLGCPLPIFYIRHDALKAHLAGHDVRKLLVDGEERLFPVYKDGKVVSSVVVAKQEGVWSFKSLGDSNLVKDLSEVRDRQALVSGKGLANYFIVHIPSMYHMFIGHYDSAGKLMLTHIHDNAEYGFARHATQTGEQVINAILPKAKTGRHSLPIPDAS
jgi:hypothetical protein